MHSKLKNDIAESFVVYKLLEMGLEVFNPVNAQSKTDIVVKNHSGKLFKVQIKSSNAKKDGVINFNVAKNNIKYNAGSYRVHYNVNDVDLFLCVNLIDMEIYVMLFRENASSFKVRFEATKNGQNSKVNVRDFVLLNENYFS